MKYKYGEFTQSQIQDYKKFLHSKIHWLLIYEETDYPQLPEYIVKLQLHIAGLAELIDSSFIISLASVIEAIRLEYTKKNYSHYLYRKLVFDAHSIVDSLPEMDGDADE